MDCDLLLYDLEYMGRKFWRLEEENRSQLEKKKAILLIHH